MVPAATRTSVGITSKSASATYVPAELAGGELDSTTAHSEEGSTAAAAAAGSFTSLHKPASSTVRKTRNKKETQLSDDEMV